MNTFKLKIVSLDKTFFDGEAVYCSVVTKSGKIGFKAHHEPFVSVIKNNSQIEYQDQSGKKESVKITGGLFAFENNECTATVH